MSKLNDKFGVSAKQITRFIEDCKKSSDRATLQGKLSALTSADVLLRSAFLVDILEPDKKLSLISQRESNDIITTVTAVKKARDKYVRWQEIFSENPEKIFDLPGLKRVLSNLNDDDNSYQGIKLRYFQREKQYVQDYAASIIEKVIQCFDVKFGKLGETSDDVLAEVKEGDSVLFHICRVLNTKVWPKEVNQQTLSLQIESLTHLYEHFKKMPIFQDTCLEELTDGYTNIVDYNTTYFPFQAIEPINMWKKVFPMKTDDDKEDWRTALLVIEICFCAPHSNAVLERFFSQLKFVKSFLRSRLSEDVLNALLRIRVSGPTIEEFHAKHVDRCVEKWYTSKNRRLHQIKRKLGKKKENIQTDHASCSSDTTSNESESDDEKDQ